MKKAVDVCMLTYNHELFIEQAIESVLLQKTDFPVRVVIGDDGSSDQTRTIIAKYKQQYPERFLLLLPEKNIGVMHNFKQTLEACTAPYIAILDGDDYWSDPNKLQQQVDFLEQHPDYSLSFHDAEIFWTYGTEAPVQFSTTKPQVFGGGRTEFTHADVVRDGWFMPTASLVFRRAALLPLPTWFTQVFSGDYTVHLLVSKAGKVHYIPKVMSSYRMHQAGISQQMNSPVKIAKKIQENIFFRSHFAPEHRAKFRRSISDLQIEHGTALKQAGQYGGMTKSWLAGFTTDPIRVSRTFAGKLVRGQLFR